MNFICGDRFIEIADFIYMIPSTYDYYNYPNTFDPTKIEAFNGIPIIYTFTHHLKSLLPLLKMLNKRVVLVTHNSDDEVIKELYDILPLNVIRWFAICVMHNGSRLEPIPIGLENERWARVFGVNKPQKILHKQKEEKTYKNLLYLNITVGTNLKERELPYKLLHDKPFVTNCHANKYDFDGFIDNIYRHKFVLCPRGNGTDSHRTWETLYLDSIPVLRRTHENSFYRDLPICFVNQWEEVTEEFLNKEYDRIINAEWNLEKLDFDFWKERILSFTQ